MLQKLSFRRLSAPRCTTQKFAVFVPMLLEDQPLWAYAVASIDCSRIQHKWNSLDDWGNQSLLRELLQAFAYLTAHSEKVVEWAGGSSRWAGIALQWMSQRRCGVCQVRSLFPATSPICSWTTSRRWTLWSEWWCWSLGGWFQAGCFGSDISLDSCSASEVHSTLQDIRFILAIPGGMVITGWTAPDI